MSWSDRTSTSSSLNLTILLSSLTSYYFIEQLFRHAASSSNPRFYRMLRNSRKDFVFFGIAMGLLITILSTPSCVLAALDVWHSPLDNRRNDPWDLGPHARVCIAARGVLWVSELNRLDMYGLYVIHHAGSILSLVSWLHLQWPSLPFLILFATLVSEIPGDLVFMVSAYRDTLDQVLPRLEQFRTYLIQFNALQYALIRGAGILIVTWMLWSGTPGLYHLPIGEQLYAYSLLALYAAFCASYVLRQLKSRKPPLVSTPPLRPGTPEKLTDTATIHG